MEAIRYSLIPFLAILNPFALCLYLVGTMEDLSMRAFLRVLAGACLISLSAFILCAVAGETILYHVLGVRIDAMRAFGGVIFFIVAYRYVMQGYRATEILRGSLEELPSAIALPYMIGAGTITQSILLGKQHNPIQSSIVLTAGMVLCFVAVVCFKLLRDRMRGARERIFDRYVNTLARINGLLIGAISTEMIVTGIEHLWTNC